MTFTSGRRRNAAAADPERVGEDGGDDATDIDFFRGKKVKPEAPSDDRSTLRVNALMSGTCVAPTDLRDSEKLPIETAAELVIEGGQAVRSGEKTKAERRTEKLAIAPPQVAAPSRRYRSASLPDIATSLLRLSPAFIAAVSEVTPKPKRSRVPYVLALGLIVVVAVLGLDRPSRMFVLESVTAARTGTSETAVRSIEMVRSTLVGPTTRP